MIRVLIIDDHPLFGEAICDSLKLAWPRVELIEATTIEAAIRTIRSSGDFDLIVLDLMLRDTIALEGLADIRMQFRDIPVLIIADYYHHQIVTWLFRFGAKGFITKAGSKSEIAQAAQNIVAGRCYLTAPTHRNMRALPDYEASVALKRLSLLTAPEIRVLSRVRKGLRNKEIAVLFNVSEKTIKVHMSRAMGKLGVNNRTQAAAEFLKLEFGQLALRSFFES